MGIRSIKWKPNFLSGAQKNGVDLATMDDIPPLDPAIFPVIADPAAPDAGELSIFAKLIVGRPMLKALSPVGVGYALQPHLFQQFIQLIQSNANISTTIIGCTSLNTGTLTNSSSSEATGTKLKATSAASAAATAGFSIASNSYRRGSVAGANGFFVAMRFDFEDADYPNSRLFAGMSNAAISATVAADDPGANHFGINRLGSETNWYVTSEGLAGSQLRADSGMPFVVGHLYDLYLYCAPQGDTVYWRIDDLTAATSVEGSRNTNLPVASTAMKPGIQVGTIDAVARSVSFARIYGEADR